MRRSVPAGSAGARRTGGGSFSEARACDTLLRSARTRPTRPLAPATATATELVTRNCRRPDGAWPAPPGDARCAPGCPAACPGTQDAPGPAAAPGPGDAAAPGGSPGSSPGPAAAGRAAP